MIMPRQLKNAIGEFITSLLLVSILLQQITFDTIDWSVDARRSPHLKCGETGAYNYREQPASQQRIFGGQQAKPGEFAYQAIVLNEATGVFCGGSIISEKYVLTAAHCLMISCDGYTGLSVASPDDIRVRVGELNLRKNDGEREYFVERVIAHDQYCHRSRGSTIGDDLALLKISGKFKFKITPTGYGSVNRICLPKAGAQYSAGTKVYASGWGLTTNGVSSQFGRSKDLMKVKVDIVSDDDCREDWSASTHGLAILPDGLICASSKSSKGICNGDSGGPLTMRLADGRMELVGVSAFVSKKGCASGLAPDAFTKVSHYIDWIREYVHIIEG